MKNEIRKELGFEFVKVGEFYLAEKQWGTIRASLKLISAEYRNADETVYLVYSDDELKYVGEYTYNLSDRWLSGDYVNHHKSDCIEKELGSGKTVSLWLAIEPFLTNGSTKINVSKSIEHELLRQRDTDWNTRNKIKKWEEWRSKNCIPVKKIVNDV